MKALIGILVIGLVTSAYGDTAKKEETPKKEKLSAPELQVMAHYHAVNQLEIDLGKAAKKNAGTQAVKSYGEMLVKDHTEGDKKLEAIAKASGQKIPAEKPATEAEKAQEAQMKKEAAALKKLKGADFDREYLRMMVDGHEKELAAISSKMAEVTNPQLLDFLSALKPTLQHHADEARELQKSGATAMHQQEKK